MDKRKLGGLLGLALLVLALAWWQGEQRTATANLHSGEFLFPGLREQINEVTGLVIQDSGARVASLRLRDGQWQVEEKQGFPADAGKLRSALLILAEARIVEEKTSRPEMYSRLGVEDPGTPGAENLWLTIELGEAQRGLVIGKPAMGNSHYVRRTSEATSLLVNQGLSMSADPITWLQTAILDIDAGQIERIDIVHAPGEVLAITRGDGSSENFVIENLPDEREAISDFAANGMASSLARLSFSDVRRKQGAVATDSTTATFTTLEGLVITLTLQAGNPAWASFTFSPETLEVSAAVTGQASDYSAHLSDWEFAIPGQRAEQLRKRLDELLKPLE